MYCAHRLRRPHACDSMHPPECMKEGAVPDHPAGACDATLKDLLWSGAPVLLSRLSGSAVEGFIQSEQASIWSFRLRRQPECRGACSTITA
jgi:hypothetical protein